MTMETGSKSHSFDSEWPHNGDILDGFWIVSAKIQVKNNFEQNGGRGYARKVPTDFSIISHSLHYSGVTPYILLSLYTTGYKLYFYSTGYKLYLYYPQHRDRATASSLLLCTVTLSHSLLQQLHSILYANYIHYGTGTYQRNCTTLA